MIARIPLAKGAYAQQPSRIVVHAMAEFITDRGREWHAPEFLKNIGLSAHSLITPSGVRIRCRRETQGAYHARGFNRDSLGIEVLVPGVHDYDSFIEAIKTPYMTKTQYHATVDQCREWLDEFHILSIDRHSDVDPERKHDPGDGFPWTDLLSDIGWQP